MKKGSADATCTGRAFLHVLQSRAIMLDTKGPEYRIGEFKDGKITVEEGRMFTFTTDDIIGDEHQVSVSYKGLRKDIEIKDRILVNNGLVVFEVEGLHGNDIICRVIVGGELSNNKSINIPSLTSATSSFDHVA